MSCDDKINSATESRKKYRHEEAIQYKEKIYTYQNQAEAAVHADIESSSSEGEH